MSIMHKTGSHNKAADLAVLAVLAVGPQNQNQGLPRAWVATVY